MSKKYYRVYFDWSCNPEKQGGRDEPCEDKFTFYETELLEDVEILN